ncbi:MAG TPA: C2 family cysteine protease [Terriglobia bacterium]|nr:C2 family cysteine protease [Terriglobia bacterium]
MRAHMTFLLVMSFPLCPVTTRAVGGLRRAQPPDLFHAWNAAPQSAQGIKRGPKSQAELDALRALANEKDPHEKLLLADTFLKHYPDTEMHDVVYTEMMIAHAQLGEHQKAVDAGNLAIQDNPESVSAFYYLGIVYMDPPPLDFDKGFWYSAHAVAMAKAAQNKAAPDLESDLIKTYVDYHGSKDGLDDIITQAGGAPKPPDGFLVPGPKLYGPEGISPASVKQGGLGSCYFHSTVAALAQSSPDLLKGMITDNGNGTYVVQFRDGKKENVYPEDLRFARSSRFDRSDGQWVGVLFRAYAQRVLRESLLKGVDLADMFPLIKPYAKSFVETTDPLLLAYDRSIRAVVNQAGDIDKAQLEAMLKSETKDIPIPDTFKDSLLQTLESSGVFDVVAQEVKQNGELFGAYRAIGHGGIPARVMQTLLAKEPLGAKIKSADQVAELLSQVSPSKQPIVAGTTGLSLKDLQAQKSVPGGTDQWYVEGHAYTVMSYDLQAQTVTLRNPWGEHPAPDGVFTIPLTTFANSFELIQTVEP